MLWFDQAKTFSGFQLELEEVFFVSFYYIKHDTNLIYNERILFWKVPKSWLLFYYLIPSVKSLKSMLYNINFEESKYDIYLPNYVSNNRSSKDSEN